MKISIQRTLMIVQYFTKKWVKNKRPNYTQQKVHQYCRKYLSKTKRFTFMDQNGKNKFIHFCIKTN